MSADTFPTLIVEIAFLTDPFDASPDWEDVSADVRAISTDRHRQNELDQFQAGTCTVTLDNRLRTYDPTYADGDWFGFILPMRRIRIRASYNAGSGSVTYPLFDGFIDSWDQQYTNPNDAVAVVSATDGFKVLAAAQLPASVYQLEVAADNPTRWYRLDEPASSTDVFDAVAKADGTPVNAPTFGATGMVTKDPGSALSVTGALNSGNGFTTDIARFPPAVAAGTGAFSVEFWVKCGNQTDEATVFHQGDASTGLTGYVWVRVRGAGAFVGKLELRTALATFRMSTVRVDDGAAHHCVVTRSSGGTIKVFVDGVDRTDSGSGADGSTSIVAADSFVGYTFGGVFGLTGTVQHLAVYDTALSATRVGVHNDAGRTPWAGDSPGVRIGRVLDQVGWPSALRDLDAGSSSLQSASLGVTVLAHAQKVSESEFGDLFMTADGKVRLISRTGLLNRDEFATFGDSPGSGELGYTALELDYSDQLIRNSVTVSRNDGVAQTVEDDTSVTAVLRHSYSRDGLLHDSDTMSRGAAEFLVSEYKDPLLRVSGLSVAPRGNPSVLFPQVLGRELGDEVTVKRRPQGVGDPISQDSVIQGVSHTFTPKWWETKWSLSPAFAGAFLQLDNPDVTIEGSNPGRIYF